MNITKKLLWVSIAVGIICSMSACGASEKRETVSQIEKLEVDMDALKTAVKGEQFEIKNVKEDTVYMLNINRIQESLPGITSISADIGGIDNAQASLIMRDGKLFGILNFYKKMTLYEVGYDTTIGMQYMKKMGPGDIDKIEGSKPLVPKQKPLGN